MEEAVVSVAVLAAAVEQKEAEEAEAEVQDQSKCSSKQSPPSLQPQLRGPSV